MKYDTARPRDPIKTIIIQDSLFPAAYVNIRHSVHGEGKYRNENARPKEIK